MVRPEHVRQFRDALEAHCRSSRGRFLPVRLDVDGRGRLSALLVADDGTFEGVVPTSVGLETFAPEADPRLFRTTTWGHFCRDWISAESCVPVAYRPMKRIMFRTVNEAGEVRFVKVHRRRLSNEQVRLVNRAHTFPRLVERRGMGPLSAEVWSPVSGPTVRHQLEQGDTETWLPATAASLSRLAATDPASAPVTDMSTLTADAETSLQRARVLLAPIPDGAGPDMSALRDELHSFPDAPMVASHGDCHDAQLIITDDHVCMLDPDSLGRAPLEWDIATLAAHIDLAAIRNPDAHLDPCTIQGGLVAAWSRELPRDVSPSVHPGRLDVLRRLVLARLAGVYARRPLGNEHVPALLAAVSRARVLAALLLSVLVVAEFSPASAETKAPAALRDGQWAEVHGEHRPGNRMKADEVEIKVQDGTRRYQIEGLIEAISADPRTFTLVGLSVEIDDATILHAENNAPLAFDTFTVGSYVKVAGLRRGRSDHPIADEVRLLPLDTWDGESEIEGEISRVKRDDRGVSFRVVGRRVRLSSDADVRSHFPSAFIAPIDASAVSRARTNDDWQPPGRAFLHPSLSFGGRVSARVQSDTELTLSPATGGDLFESGVHSRLYGLWRPSSWVEGFSELRWTGTRVFETDLANIDETRGDMRWGPTYLFLRAPRAPWFAMQAGRLDLEDDREWFYDQNLDGARGFVATQWARAELGYYRTDLTPKSATRDEGYVIARIDSPHRAWLRPEAFFVRRFDHRDATADRTWYGLRLPTRIRPLRTWTDIAVARGDFRGLDVRSWAFDVGINARWSEPFRGSMTVSRASGSGDDDRGDGFDRENRDTGLADNNGSFGGLQSFRYYGDLSRPELSNIDISTLGAGVYPVSWMSVDVVYHMYRQRAHRDRFRSDLLIRPDATSRDIGTETDVIVGLRVATAIDLEFGWARFTPGLAFTSRDPSSQVRMEIEWRR